MPARRMTWRVGAVVLCVLSTVLAVAACTITAESRDSMSGDSMSGTSGHRLAKLDVTPSLNATAAAVFYVTTCEQTSSQLAVETALAKIGTYGPIVVDGIQTNADCETIKRFQRRMGIVPAAGRAGPTTLNVAQRIAATDYRACKAGTATMACIDLTHQTFYIMKGGKVALGPTVTRTGKPGFRTPAGSFKINARSLRAWSSPYHVWLPYWQHFYHGMGLHETTTYIHNMAIGSHGCVNLLHTDAATAYSLLRYGSIVRSYGRRPGT